MKKELFRLTKSRTLWTICIATVVIFFAFATEYCLNAKSSDNYIYHYISEYKSDEEIPTYVEELESLKSTVEGDDYERDLQDIEQSVSIYNYLYENGISYSEFKKSYSTYMGMYDKSDNRIIYTEYMLKVSSVLLLIALTVCSTVLICYDFSSDLYKNIYGTNIKRSNIYKSKLSAYLVFAAAVMFVLFLLTFITSLQCGITTANVICFLGNKLFVIKSSLYILLNYVMQIIGVLPFMALIFGLSSMIKNTYINLLLCAASCLMPFSLSYMYLCLGRNWYVLRIGLMNMFNGFYPSWVFIVVFLLESALSAICCLLGNRLFIKRNL